MSTNGSAEKVSEEGNPTVSDPSANQRAEPGRPFSDEAAKAPEDDHILRQMVAGDESLNQNDREPTLGFDDGNVSRQTERQDVEQESI